MKWPYEHQAGDMYTQIVAKCYKAYQEELRRSEAMDFDDLIMMTYVSLTKILMSSPIISNVISTFTWMSTKIPTMLNISW